VKSGGIVQPCRWVRADWSDYGYRVRRWLMPLSAYQVRTSIAVSDIQTAVAFYEGKLGLPVLGQRSPQAHHRSPDLPVRQTCL
jgi:hypothetical protein